MKFPAECVKLKTDAEVHGTNDYYFIIINIIIIIIIIIMIIVSL